MSLAPFPQFIHLTEPQVIADVDGPDVEVEIVEGEDKRNSDDNGNLLSIEHDDGSITVSLDGKPIEEREGDNPPGWFDNLVDDIDDMELGSIAEELLRGIDDDIQSRQDWIEDRAQGIRLLGLRLEVPGVSGASDGAPVEGMSRIRHPMLLEAVLRFQANARSELLPTDGPVKIRDDANGTTAERDRLADALERDMNHYLTSVATEYYPDTDRMLLMLGFGGTAFKKVYFCPLRNRPVSESVDADNLIVSNNATDLRNARRITHRTMLKPSTVRRLQILGVYRDIDLTTPVAPELDAAQEEKNAVQGVSSTVANPDDQDREIYECYCELDLPGFEHRYKGKVSGLEVPYRVTIDVSSREILSIVRNFDEEDRLPEARDVFVKYTFVPGMGFYDIGLLHILGNATNAVTAAWRELLDAGMFASFPGFLISDTGARQNTNIFRVPPGGAALVKDGGRPLRDAIMPLPYKDPSPALMTLAENIAQTGARIGGTAEMQVGEGRADAPVGTTLAMIEQATKVMNAVHKRMHAAQAQEFRLLMRCFRENPESFWERNKKPSMQWDEATLVQALNDNDLTPQADPNTASHSMRIMKVVGLKQLQASNPTLYDGVAVDRAALNAMGWNNPDQFFVEPSKRAQPTPEVIKGIEELKIKKQQADAQTTKANADAAKAHAEGVKAQASLMGDGNAGQQVDTEVDHMNAQAKLMDAETKRHAVHVQSADVALDNENRERDRQADLHKQALETARDMMAHPEEAHVAKPLLKKAGLIG